MDEFEILKKLIDKGILTFSEQVVIEHLMILVGEFQEEIKRLNNELTGYKLSNQSLSNALEKEIKENGNLVRLGYKAHELKNFD